MMVPARGIGPDFTFFIGYGRVSHVIDLSAVTVAEREFPLLTAQEVNLRMVLGGPRFDLASSLEPVHA
jgi:beta-lysine 5,6-aminomutase beta subunit